MSKQIALNKIVLITRGRTGSTAVIDELGKTPRAVSVQEIFSAGPDLEYYPTFPPFNGWRGKRLLGRILREEILADWFLKKLHRHAARSGAYALFWKLLSHQFEERPYLCELIKRHAYQAIYLKRNPVKQVLSGIVAGQRNVYNQKEKIQDRNKYDVDIDKFRWLVEWEKTSVISDCEFLKNNGFRFMEITYEEFVNDRSGFFSKIFCYFSLPLSTPGKSDFAIMIDDLQSTIRNYDQVCAAASDLGFPV
jgi:LPS sulfotransferase NodH